MFREKKDCVLVKRRASLYSIISMKAVTVLHIDINPSFFDVVTVESEIAQLQ